MISYAQNQSQSIIKYRTLTDEHAESAQSAKSAVQPILRSPVLTADYTDDADRPNPCNLRNPRFNPSPDCRVCPCEGVNSFSSCLKVLAVKHRLAAMATAFQEIKQSLRRLYSDDAHPGLVGFSGLPLCHAEHVEASQPYPVTTRHFALDTSPASTPSCGNSQFGMKRQNPNREWTRMKTDTGSAGSGPLRIEVCREEQVLFA